MLDEGKSITDEVLAAMASTPNLRTLKVLGSAVRHLHDFVRDVDLTETEWAHSDRILDAHRPDVHTAATRIHPVV